MDASWGLWGCVLGRREAGWGASLGPLGGVLARLGGVLGRPGRVLGGSRAVWGPSGPHLQKCTKTLGTCTFSRVLGASWRRLGASWCVLGASWGRLGPSWGVFGRAVWKGRNCIAFGLGILGRLEGVLGANMAPSWFQNRAKIEKKSKQKSIKILMALGVGFLKDFGGFGKAKWSQVGTNIEPKIHVNIEMRF